MPFDRRTFLSHGIFSLAVVSAGALTLSGCGLHDGSAAAGSAAAAAGSAAAAADGIAPVAGPNAASFRWALGAPSNGSAYAYFLISRDITLQGFEIDASIAPSIHIGSQGSAQAVCRGWISRGVAPSVISGPAEAPPGPPSADFGPIGLHNPNGISANHDSMLNANVFYSAVLRSFVPAHGTDAGGSHRFFAPAALSLYAGDYLVLEIGQSGIASSVYMQAVLNYS